MTTKPEDIARLGRAVRDRRTELRMTQDGVASAGGPSDVTIRNIEAAKVKRINRVTLAKLDTGLGWTPGTAAAHLDGASGDDVSTAPRPMYVHEASDADLLLEISRRMSEMRRDLERTPDKMQRPDDLDASVERPPRPHGSITRLSDRRPRLLSDDAPEGWEELPSVADEDKPGDDPGEDDD